jgi:glycosyltransferase involved in cell wall biosynthesis
MNTCDIIIPAYNNPAVLQRGLAALIKQSTLRQWRVKVIIIDDGSSPPIKLPAINSQFPLVLLSQAHAGAAAARNQGIAASTADILVFLGADILLRPTALRQHLAFHQQNPDQRKAALGMVMWDPRIRPTPFMEWMMHGGHHNNFDAILGKQTADPKHFFYGSHVSLKRAAIPKGGFPEMYNQYGWEDLDLGWQLAKQGIVLHVLHTAVGLHDHPYSARAIYTRQYAAGQGMPLFQARHPDNPTLPHMSRSARQKLIFYRMPPVRSVLQKIIGKLGKQYSLPRLFAAITTAEFWLGVIAREK